MKVLHPLPLRIWHWVNTALILTLMITGLKLRVPDLAILDYKSAVVVHKAVGFVMAASFLFWLAWGIAGGSIRRYYAVRRRDFTGLFIQGLYYGYGVFRGGKNPFPATVEQKFNPLQKVAYLSVQFFFTPVILVTGILFGNILFFRDAIAAIGGLRILDAIHVVVAYVFVVYLLVHVYMSTMGRTPLSHIKEMFTGRPDDD